jgi:hypothetical protein
MTAQEAAEATWTAAWTRMSKDETAGRDRRKGIKAAMGQRFILRTEIGKRAREAHHELDYGLTEEEAARYSGDYLSAFYSCLANYLRALGYHVTDLGVLRGLVISWRSWP